LQGANYAQPRSLARYSTGYLFAPQKKFLFKLSSILDLDFEFVLWNLGKRLKPSQVESKYNSIFFKEVVIKSIPEGINVSGSISPSIMCSFPFGTFLEFDIVVMSQIISFQFEVKWDLTHNEIPVLPMDKIVLNEPFKLTSSLEVGEINYEFIDIPDGLSIVNSKGLIKNGYSEYEHTLNGNLHSNYGNVKILIKKQHNIFEIVVATFN